MEGTGGVGAAVHGDGVQFPVQDNVKLGTRMPATKQSVRDALMSKAGAKAVEFASPLPPDSVLLFQDNNLLAQAVHKAFYGHFPWL